MLQRWRALDIIRRIAKVVRVPAVLFWDGRIRDAFVWHDGAAETGGPGHREYSERAMRDSGAADS